MDQTTVEGAEKDKAALLAAHKEVEDANQALHRAVAKRRRAIASIELGPRPLARVLGITNTAAADLIKQAKGGPRRAR